MKKRIPITKYQVDRVLKPIAKNWSKNFDKSQVYNFLQSQLGYSVSEPISKNLVDEPFVHLSLLILRSYSKISETLDLPEEALKIVERCYIQESNLRPFLVCVAADESMEALELSHSPMEDYRSNLQLFARISHISTLVFTCYALSAEDAIGRAGLIKSEPASGLAVMRMILGKINPLDSFEKPDVRLTALSDPLANRLYYGPEIFADRLKNWHKKLPLSVQNEFLELMARGHDHITYITENLIELYMQENPDFDPATMREKGEDHV